MQHCRVSLQVWEDLVGCMSHKSLKLRANATMGLCGSIYYELSHNEKLKTLNNELHVCKGTQWCASC